MDVTTGEAGETGLTQPGEQEGEDRSTCVGGTENWSSMAGD